MPTEITTSIQKIPFSTWIVAALAAIIIVYLLSKNAKLKGQIYTQKSGMNELIFMAQTIANMSSSATTALREVAGKTQINILHHPDGTFEINSSRQDPKINVGQTIAEENLDPIISSGDSVEGPEEYPVEQESLMADQPGD